MRFWKKGDEGLHFSDCFDYTTNRAKSLFLEDVQAFIGDEDWVVLQNPEEGHDLWRPWMEFRQLHSRWVTSPSSWQLLCMFHKHQSSCTNQSGPSSQSARTIWTKFPTYFGVLKYNSVFVTDESLDILQEQGFGAVSRVIKTIAEMQSFISFFSQTHLWNCIFI